MTKLMFLALQNIVKKIDHAGQRPVGGIEPIFD